MTKNFLLLIAVITAIIFSGCKEDEKKTLTVDITEKSIINEVGTFTFKITSNTEWTINSSETWCALSPDAGSNDGTITVNYDKNPTTTERTCNIVISGTDVSELILIVTQVAGVEKLYPSKLSIFHPDSPQYNSYDIYTYDDKHKVINIVKSDNSKAEYEYNTNNLVEKRTYYNTEGVITAYDIYDYNSDNKIEKITSYGEPNKNMPFLTLQDDNYFSYYQKPLNNKSIVTIEKLSWETLIYSDGKIIKKDLYDIDDVQIGYSEYEYDSNSNVSKRTYYNINEDASEWIEYEYTYTYDNKTYMFINVVGSRIYPNYYNMNNKLGYDIIFYNEDGTVAHTYSTSYTYEYNEKGFPIKRVKDGDRYFEYEYITAVKK